ncbi:MAG: amidohydrolase family protein [Mycetocola sp.]
MSVAVIRDVRWPDTTERLDVWIADGRVAAIEPHDPDPDGVRLAQMPEGIGLADGTLVDVWQGEGRVLIPGLWDEHTHFRQWALSRRRLDLSAADSAADAAARVTEALSRRSGPVEVRLDGAGFRDGLWTDEPTTALLDAVSQTTPIVLVSADLHCGWMNTAGLRAMGLPEDSVGPVREDDWIPHLDRLALDDAHTLPALVEAAQAAAARGVVGVVDMETDDNLARWPERVAAGVTALRVEAAVWAHQLDEAIAAGVRSGDTVPHSDGLVTVGPMKVIVDGSLNTRTAYCFDNYEGGAVDDEHPSGYLAMTEPELDAVLDRAVRSGFRPAVHAIGDRANRIVLDAFERLADAGLSTPHGRVEHAQLLTEADVPRFARLGLIASVQPEHAMDDRDVSDRFWPGKAERSFPLRDLRDSGAELRFGSDAPVAPLDPWLAIAAAVTRTREGRAPWGPSQRIGRSEALAATTRGRTTVRVGDVADLVLLDADPLLCSDQELREMPVALTLRGGQPTWSTGPSSTVPSTQP